jgi:hypothetical protein
MERNEFSGGNLGVEARVRIELTHKGFAAIASNRHISLSPQWFQ